MHADPFSLFFLPFFPLKAGEWEGVEADAHHDDSDYTILPSPPFPPPREKKKRFKLMKAMVSPSLFFF